MTDPNPLLTNPTTEEHFEIFKSECRKWIEVFGLKGWQIEFHHRKNLDASRASVGYRVIARVAAVYLEPDWEDDGITEARIKRSAFHEIMEIWLADLAIGAKDRFTTEDAIDKEVHNLIRTLENVVWEPTCQN